MTWFASSTNEAESLKEHAFEFRAVDADFPSGHARVWSGLGNITIGGNTFFGVGNLGSITTPTDQIGLNANQKTFRLSGVDFTLISETDLENCFGRSIITYLGFLNPDTMQLIDTPEIEWEGRMDTINRLDGKSPYIEINAEHRMVLLQEMDGWRYTDEHQQLFYAGDLGFNQVKAIQNKELSWGGSAVSAGTPGGTIGGNGRAITNKS